jgi:hypothetical protein
MTYSVRHAIYCVICYLPSQPRVQPVAESGLKARDSPFLFPSSSSSLLSFLLLPTQASMGARVVGGSSPLHPLDPPLRAAVVLGHTIRTSSVVATPMERPMAGMDAVMNMAAAIFSGNLSAASATLTPRGCARRARRAPRAAARPPRPTAGASTPRSCGPRRSTPGARCSQLRRAPWIALNYFLAILWPYLVPAPRAVAQTVHQNEVVPRVVSIGMPGGLHQLPVVRVGVCCS